MPRKSVVSREIEYGIASYSILDIRYNKIIEMKSIFYPADMIKRKVEKTIKERVNMSRNGQFYHFLGIDKIERRVSFFKMPIQEYITYNLNHNYYEEKGEKL